MIADSSVLILLAKTNKLDLLHKLYQKIIIPEKVKDEILIPEKEGYLKIKEALEKKKIVIKNPSSNNDFGLGKGENAVLNLAIESKDSVIMDDRAAILKAKTLGIEYIRTTDLASQALKKGYIDKNQARLFIDDLIKAGCYISTSVYIDIINRLNKY